MNYFLLVFNGILLGTGLAMDAFSVSVANGLDNSLMNKRETCKIAGTFALFQFAMPLIGYFFVKTLADIFNVINKFIPWISLILLLFIGGKMIIESVIKTKKEKSGKPYEKKETEVKTGWGQLILQGIATSIDALSVGFTIAEYKVFSAILTSAIIAVVTFMICYAGVFIGKKFGTSFSGKTEIVGGAILIAIGIEIFVKGIFF